MSCHWRVYGAPEVPGSWWGRWPRRMSCQGRRGRLCRAPSCCSWWLQRSAWDMCALSWREEDAWGAVCTKQPLFENAPLHIDFYQLCSRPKICWTSTRSASLLLFAVNVGLRFWLALISIDIAALERLGVFPFFLTVSAPLCVHHFVELHLVIILYKSADKERFSLSVIQN